MFFRLLYVIFVTCMLLWGHFYIGGIITPRQIMTLVMFVACAAVKEIKIDKYWWIYLVFIAFFGLSSVFTGYFTFFQRQLIGFYFASFVSYRSTIVIIKKYHSETTLINTLLVIGVADAVITIGQYLNIPLFNRIVELMHFVSLNDQFLRIQERSDVVNRIAVPGIVGAVFNGYFLSFISVLAFFNKKGRLRLRNLIVWSVIIAGSYCAQERSGFFGAIFISIFIIIKLLSTSSQKSKPILVPILIIGTVFGVVNFMGMLAESETRHSLGVNLIEDRLGLFRRAWAFFLDNPMGGFFEFVEINGIYPHNLFLNALIQGGLLGGIALFVVLIMQFSKIIPSFVKSLKGYDDFVVFIFAFATTAYTINSLVHNLSIASGDANYWILWGAFLAMMERRKETSRQFNNQTYPIV